MTNYEWLEGLSIEDKAKALSNLMTKKPYCHVPVYADCGFPTCEGCFLKWLKEQREESNNV